jgi:prepilin-type N-terminal cleavage/methylation domain-containing protein/prepilin-type processing-associated H-X9-DG protein
MNSSQDIQGKAASRRAAFTLVELVAVIAVVALLAMIAYPALAKTKNNGHAAQCMSNLRRLTAAWTMYVDDNSGRLIHNGIPVAGNMSWTASSDNTNSTMLVDPAQSLLAKYVKDATLYKCPADQYQSALNPGPRVRSVSMNAVLGGTTTFDNQIPGRTYFNARKMSDLTTPGPASIFVLLDEHPDSINDSIFHVILGSSPVLYTFRDLPGSFHNNSGSFSFADGHCEMKRWRDSRTLRQVSYIDYINTVVRNSEDYIWLNDHSPYKN